MTVTGVNDDLDDGDIAYSIVTAAATSADGTYNGINAADVTVTNTDNDASGITVSTISGPTTEAGGTATFTVVLDAQPTADVTVGLSSNDATEGTVLPASLTFTSANWNSAQTVTVTGVNDDLDDGDIAFSIVTAAATSADGIYNGINAADVNVTNTDNDASGVTVSTISGPTTEAGGTATFTVVLDAQPTADVTVGLLDQRRDRGHGPPGVAHLHDCELEQRPDGDRDGRRRPPRRRRRRLQHRHRGGHQRGRHLQRDQRRRRHRHEHRQRRVRASRSRRSAVTTTEAGGTATFTVVLDAQPTADVTVGLSSNDATEGTVLPASLTFTSANWNSAQTVTVTGVDDLLDDGDIAFSIVTAAATSADGIYNGINAADVTVTNTDNDASGITVSTISGDHDGGRRHGDVHRRARRAADGRRDGRPLVQRRDRRHGPAGVADLHECQLEHRADGDRDRRRRPPG